MSKNISTFLFLMTLCTALFAQQEVTLGEVRTASAHYLSVYHPSKTSFNTSNIVSVSYITRQDKPAIYEVLYQDGNVVLLSGSKACIPVLGCNFSGNGETIVGKDNLPFGLQDMLDGMLMDIDSALMNDTITLYHQEEWDELLSVDFLNKKNAEEQHGPLLTSIWGQDISNDGVDSHAYNYDIEDTSSSCTFDYCPAGCVAVAMAQVLYYWKHPWNKGVYTYYDWCNMPDFLRRNNNPRYEIERNAVAKLIYDCGISVGMEYCKDGCQSSAKTKKAQNALRNDFMFSNDADFRNKGIRLTKNWIKFIKDDIDRGRPIIYRGRGSGGHAFVCDGYRGGDQFHFNWGWNGYQNEYWFTVKDITPEGSNYSKGQAAIFEIHPDNSYVNYCNAQVNLPAIYALCAANGVPDYWNIVPETGRILESCDQSLPSEWRNIPSGETSTYSAFERVVLNPGFTSEEGSFFTASIRECPNCNGKIILKSGSQEAEPENQEEFFDNEFLTDLFEQDDINDISVYPNPTTGDIIIKMADMVDFGEIQIINGLGIIIQTKKINSNLTYINLSELTSGIYYLLITTAEKTVSRKIIKQ